MNSNGMRWEGMEILGTWNAFPRKAKTKHLSEKGYYIGNAFWRKAITDDTFWKKANTDDTFWKKANTDGAFWRKATTGGTRSIAGDALDGGEWIRLWCSGRRPKQIEIDFSELWAGCLRGAGCLRAGFLYKE